MSWPSILEPAHAYALWAPSYPAHAHNAVMQTEERAMLGLLPSNLSGITVLDAGCGSGRYMRHVLDRGTVAVTGVDLSLPMLLRAQDELASCADPSRYCLMQGSVDALPVPDAFADIALCGLVLGHLEGLDAALGELRRATRPGGMVLCSDVHPIGHALGWARDFKSAGKRYAVRHTQHLYHHWHAACAAHGLAIESVLEPMLDPNDIPAGAHFDARALEVPVALIFSLRRIP
ncbi:class I SAM-dependent methyltransferase [Pinirhizobacter sp.]|jgi:malonyl-CoA O-methyltransferase|uniref:class I SAM-dependent methyltransferase n=1 Tax=Pinirhizobacter sp. TaxID=2950432 RepID=UPI002F3E41B8